MKHFLYLIFLFLIACSPIKESIVDPSSGEKMVGFDKDCKYRIGVTRKSDMSESEFSVLKDQHISLFFTIDSTKKNPVEILTAASTQKAKVYVTKKGVKSNDRFENVLKAYGKPLAKTVDYGKDENARIHLVYYGAFYEHLSFYKSEAHSDTILGFSISQKFVFDKEFIKE